MDAESGTPSILLPKSRKGLRLRWDQRRRGSIRPSPAWHYFNLEIQTLDIRSGLDSGFCMRQEQDGRGRGTLPHTGSRYGTVSKYWQNKKHSHESKGQKNREVWLVILHPIFLELILLPVSIGNIDMLVCFLRPCTCIHIYKMSYIHTEEHRHLSLQACSPSDIAPVSHLYVFSGRFGSWVSACWRTRGPTTHKFCSNYLVSRASCVLSRVACVSLIVPARAHCLVYLVVSCNCGYICHVSILLCALLRFRCILMLCVIQAPTIPRIFDIWCCSVKPRFQKLVWGYPAI